MSRDNPTSVCTEWALPAAHVGSFVRTSTTPTRLPGSPKPRYTWGRDARPEPGPDHHPARDCTLMRRRGRRRRVPICHPPIRLPLRGPELTGSLTGAGCHCRSPVRGAGASWDRLGWVLGEVGWVLGAGARRRGDEQVDAVARGERGAGSGSRSVWSSRTETSPTRAARWSRPVCGRRRASRGRW